MACKKGKRVHTGAGVVEQSTGTGIGIGIREHGGRKQARKHPASVPGA